MKRFWQIYTACLLLTGCADGYETPENGNTLPSGMAEVRLAIPGMLTASPTAADTRTDDFTPDGETLKDKKLLPLEEGSTVWLLIDGKTTSGGSEGEGETYHNLKSYVVRGEASNQYLYPCTVDEAGNVIKETGTLLTVPYGTYTFRAMSPARTFRDEQGEAISIDKVTADNYFQLVSNGDYLISNDERYTQTQGKGITIQENDDKVQVVEINPLINQTAQLKFTITADESINLEVLSAGVEISGLQGAYGKKNADGTYKLWNWSPALADTLIAYPGLKDEYITIHRGDERITHPSSHSVVIESGILPTDATSTPLIILFNLAVNNIPTQYEMTLNQKIFRAGYSYHYKGTIIMNEGITTLTWQTVSWDTEIEIDKIE